MTRTQIIGQLYEEYRNHMESIKETVKVLLKDGNYDRDQQNFQTGYFSAYEEILQDLEIKMKE